MPKKANKRLIGLFTVASFSMFIGIVLMFIGSKIFSSDSGLIVMYFEESIKGLTIGSSVTFRGVEIGKVAKIDLATDIEDMNFSIPVLVSLNENQNFRAKNYKKFSNKDLYLEKLIEKGLRAKLMTQSYLTGQLMIELEMLPGTKFTLKNNKVFKNTIEIPTVLSSMSELSKGLQNLPIKDTLDNINKLLDIFNQKTPAILDQTTILVNNLNKLVSNNSNGVTTTVNNLNRMLVDISEAAKALKNFADYVERHPEALLKGKGRY